MTIMALILTCSIYGGQGSDLGLGIIIGEPTGICVKYFTSPTGAVAGAAAWSFSGDEKAVHIYGDYLFHLSELAAWEGGRSPFYAGVGGRAIFRDETVAGIRIPVGMSWVFDEAPFDAFLEIVPVMDIAPDTEFDVAGGAGARFWF
ncbi:MAG: hypothetical protein R6V62_06955 [Candidatus Fermentibacteraceae bacterium]